MVTTLCVGLLKGLLVMVWSVTSHVYRDLFNYDVIVDVWLLSIPMLFTFGHVVLVVSSVASFRYLSLTSFYSRHGCLKVKI